VGDIAKHFVLDHTGIIIYPSLVASLCLHFFRKHKDYFSSFISAIVACSALVVFLSFFVENKAPLKEVVLFLFAYGASIYMLFSDALLYGLANWLTRRRGENWVKELDYFYLGLGAVGVLGSVNRIELVSGQFSTYDILAPLLLATAIVIRLIKTRVEIGGWNRMDFKPY
jgi:predicted membrane channel-forming protein YqfA (hemolysin III family)